MDGNIGLAAFLERRIFPNTARKKLQSTEPSEDEPKEDEVKEKHMKDLIREKRIIVDSIKDHLIPQVSSKETQNYMHYSLAKMYEGRNINRNMNLRGQLKSTKMSQGESIQDYFTMVSQFKEKLESIRDTLYEYELVMTTFNGLTGLGILSSILCVPERKA